MKKIKLFITVVLCAFCLCFAFAGCSADGTYVENSFTTDNVSYFEYTQELLVSGSFKVKLDKAGEYTIQYDLCQTNANGNAIARETCKSNLTKSAETDKTEYTIKIYKYFTTPHNSKTVKLENVTVTLDNATPDYSGYAIGFGLVGALLLGGLVAVFVLDKLGKLNILK